MRGWSVVIGVEVIVSEGFEGVVSGGKYVEGVLGVRIGFVVVFGWCL